MTLTMSTGCTYGFEAIPSNLQIDHSVQGQVRVTWDFVCTGVIAETWDTSF
jgi:hypothetical protein